MVYRLGLRLAARTVMAEAVALLGPGAAPGDVERMMEQVGGAAPSGPKQQQKDEGGVDEEEGAGQDAPGLAKRQLLQVCGLRR